MSDWLAAGRTADELARLVSLERAWEPGAPSPGDPEPIKSPSGALPLIAIRDIPETFEQSWLVEGLIPTFANDSTAGYVFGPPKARKSLLLAEIGLCVAAGAPVLGRYAVNRTGTAVGFFAEDPKSETSRRVHRLARGKGIAVPPNLHLIDVPALAIDSEAQQQALTATLLAVPGLAFVWLDPMVRLHTVNDNRAEELGPIHTFLRKLSRSLPGVVFALAHHTNHQGGARGSTDFGAFGDFNLFLESPDDLTTRVRKIENRGGPPGEPFSYRVEDLSAADGPAMRLVPDDRDPAEVVASRSADVTTAILAFQDSHPGISGKEALKRLRATGLTFDTRKFWRIWGGRQP